MKVIDLTGKKIGRWTVVKHAGSNSNQSSLWLCRCECGTEKVIVGTVLRDNRSQSCGCLKLDALAKRSTKHGHATNGISPTYHTWAGMIARCSNPKHKHFKTYGGHGITVCERWLIFANFLADMGEKPQGTSIDRIDYSKGYSPDNCRWATPHEQARNRSNNRIIEFRGERKTLVEWAEACSIKPSIVSGRLAAGWPIEKAITQPVRRW